MYGQVAATTLPSTGGLIALGAPVEIAYVVIGAFALFSAGQAAYRLVHGAARGE